MIARTKIASLTLLFSLGLASAGFGQSLPNAKAAQKMLFSTRAKAVTVRVLAPDLMSGIDVRQIKANAPYYSSFAVSPSTGFTGSSASAALNFHSIEAANANALAACNAKIAEGEVACVLVMEVVPGKYQTRRALQLNLTASEVFKKSYRRAKGAKAFATSENTGMWGYAVKAASIEAARASAIATCQAKVAAAGRAGGDCLVVTEQ